jgi:hypothetical protein
MLETLAIDDVIEVAQLDPKGLGQESVRQVAGQRAILQAACASV